MLIGGCVFVWVFLCACVYGVLVLWVCGVIVYMCVGDVCLFVCVCVVCMCVFCVGVLMC